MKKNNFLRGALVIVFANFITLDAQSQCRDASAEQNASYERVVKALQQQLKENQPSGTWRIFDERHSLGKLQVSDEYGRLFHPCGDRYSLTLERGAASRERRARIDSAVAQANPEKQETSLVLSTDSVYSSSTPERSRELAMSTIDIDVAMNAGNYRLQEPISNRFVESYKTISVKGAPLALQINLKTDSSGIGARPETVVLLGNWKNNLRSDSKGNKLYHYSFAKGGNLIENMVITIKAPTDVAEEIIKKTDWQALNQTLVK
ncbi:hypothetical protein [Tellurirhabdus bombi]|uniref:hypothetical protein n=1 Tax=Tellurirhabdus bombi TaxID=2907205 RepID=UPI001F3D11EA|nr:hypothetical protein [Tellurirhabdus bombi]